jgi:hypothetical protein
LERGEDLLNLNNIPNTSGNLNIQQTIVLENLSDQQKEQLLNVINQTDDPMKRRPFIPVLETEGITRYEEPISITYIAEWAGQVTSVDYKSDRYSISTLYNNIYVEDLLSDSGSIYAGFISNNSIIMTSGLTDVITEGAEEILNSTMITLQRKMQTIYLEYEYPYLLNGTINENVYSWDDANKLSALLPITSIYLYDENGKILNMTSLSEPIKKTIAQNLKVRVRYDI